jgi:hypothetical protein
MLTSAPVRIGRGIWRSLVARLFWVQEAHSSNLCIPTILFFYFNPPQNVRIRSAACASVASPAAK